MTEGAGGEQAAGGGEAVGGAGTGEQIAAGGGEAAGGQGGGQSDAGISQVWHESIPADSFNERDMTVLKRFGTVDDLAKGYINAFNLVGRDKIPMPKSDAEWSEVYDRLGRPKAAEEYEINPHPDAPEKMVERMKQNVGWFKETAHKLGLTQDQAQKFYHEYTGLVMNANKQANERIEQEMSQAQQSLKSELGEAYAGKMALANRAISEVGGEELIALFERSGMGRNPVVVKAFIKMGEMMGEEVGLTKDGQPSASMDDLDAQIAEIKADPAYMDAKDPRHKTLVDKMSKLMSRRHPEPQQAPGTIRLF